MQRRPKEVLLKVFFANVQNQMADSSHGSVFKTSKFETILWSAKLVLLSVGIISTVILFKAAIIPYLSNLVISTLPSLWISLRTWLSPAVVCIILNFIIIAIAFQHQVHPNNKPISHKPIQVPQSQSSPKYQNHSIISNSHDFWRDVNEESQNPLADSNPSIQKSKDPSPDSSYPTSCLTDSGDLEAEENKETLEETWRSIMEGQGKKPRRELKKSDTWDTPPRVLNKANYDVGSGDGDDDDPVAWARRELRKSDTFNDAVSFRREKSISPEELKERAEAFINKFNYEMRMQRQESDQRFMAMVGGSG